MCGVPQAQLALTAISAVGKVQEYREQKALAASKRASQNQTRINANVAYMRDINKIDQEKVQADQEKAVAEFKTKMESKKKLAQALNLNAGNNSLEPVTEPSRTGLLLDLGTTAAQGYISYDTAKAAKE